MNAPLRILYLENDLADAELVQETLEADGIASELARVEAEGEFRAALRRGGFDLILADYTLPAFDGVSALRIVRQQLADVPFIFVSGTLGEEVAIGALQMGATDYVFKTRLSRLVPAIHRAMREAGEKVERRKQGERLQQLEAELAHMERVSIVGELAASIAHEVNQPLSGIVSSGSACLRWLAADPPNLEEARESVRRIVAAGRHAGEVIARIRALTTRTAAPAERLDLNETIRQVLVLVGDEAKRKQVTIRTVFADGLSPVTGDRVQFQQVVLNLVINGIEAMTDVSDRAREMVITTGNVDDQVQVTVEDSGMGIDPNAIEKIFEPFYTTKSTGMGMGLSISRSILQRHGGGLRVTAKCGRGASFYFTVPKYDEEESNAGV
jgi:C4-dicarboxylate-specific signal transduction histidine kinase